MSSEQNNLLQDQWSSRWAFILAATGAAVGLGNVWRFPYMAGTHGGSAFVLVYLICVLLIGIPILMAEILIGRRAQRNPVDALRSLAAAENKSKRWGLVGWLGALALLLVLSFYSVVSGWSIAYLIKSVSGAFTHVSPQHVTNTWAQFVANPWHLLLWHSVFMCLTIGVLMAGVQQGLEKASKIMMPGLYVILIILVGYAAVNGDFRAGIHFLFDFNASKITTNIVIAAMGHAFFTLALGAGAMLTYGAYMPKRVSITSSVFIVVILDVLVAILSGLAIFPLVFEHHLSPSSGPGLMFVSLPMAFSHLPGGGLVGGLFFLLLLFAAWTSSINLAEPMVIILMSRLRIARKPACFIIGLLAWFIGIGSLLSFNLWKNVHILHQYTVFDIASNVPTDILLPLGGLGFALFAGYVMSKQATRDELGSSLYSVWRFLIRYIAPIGIVIVFVSGLVG